MKKLSILLALMMSLLLALSGCGGDKAGSNGESNQDQEGLSDTKIEDADTDQAETDADLDLLEGRLAKSFIDIMSSENFTMKYKSHMDMGGGNDVEMSIEIAVKPDAQAFISQIAGQESHTIIKDQKIHIIDHANKTVLVMKDVSSEAEDVDTLSPADLNVKSPAYVGDGKEDFYGVMRDYEEYKIEKESLRYYFDGDQLVGMAIDVDGQSIKWVIENISSGVDEKLFEIPQGYQVHEMS